MTITLPIAKFAQQLIEWLRTGKVRVGPVEVTIPKPSVATDNAAVVFSLGDLSARMEASDKFSQAFDLLHSGRVSVMPGVTLVAPDPLGFDVTPIEDGVFLTWPIGKKPRVDSPLPRWLDPYVKGVELTSTGGRVVVTRGPDLEIVYS